VPRGEISDAVLEVLCDVELDGDVVRINQQLERPLYLQTNKVLEALGGRWDRKRRGHVFAEPAGERLDAALLTRSYERPNRDDYFPTPDAVAARLIEVAGIERGQMVLEPSAGRGNLADPAALAAGGKDRVHCYELRDDNCGALSAAGFTFVMRGDFLAAEPRPTYDRVVMNPPFSRRADVRHVEHALRFLKPGGRLTSLVADGPRQKEALLARATHWEGLPPRSFKAEGTNVNVVLLAIDAWR
jgi:predicted RNA methylase